MKRTKEERTEYPICFECHCPIEEAEYYEDNGKPSHLEYNACFKAIEKKMKAERAEAQQIIKRLKREASGLAELCNRYRLGVLYFSEHDPEFMITKKMQKVLEDAKCEILTDAL